MKSSMRAVGALAVLAVASLLLALTASAAVRPDDRAGVRGAGSPLAPATVRPDDRPGIRGAGVEARAVFVAGPQAGRPADGFDWNAAGAGAGVATAVVLLLGWPLIMRRTQRADVPV